MAGGNGCGPASDMLDWARVRTAASDGDGGGRAAGVAGCGGRAGGPPGGGAEAGEGAGWAEGGERSAGAVVETVCAEETDEQMDERRRRSLRERRQRGGRAVL